MRVVIAGGGGVGGQIADLLRASGHEVAIVEIAPQRAARLRQRRFPGPAGEPEVVVGNACTAQALEAAGALRADALVACTGDDAENLVVAALARRHLEVPLVVARLNEEAHRWLFDATWGVDVAVSPASALASLLRDADVATSGDRQPSRAAR